MLYIPLTTNPLGWVILGVGGYALYRAGKKKGEDESTASQITVPPEVEVDKENTEGAK